MLIRLSSVCIFLERHIWGEIVSSSTIVISHCEENASENCRCTLKTLLNRIVACILTTACTFVFAPNPTVCYTPNAVFFVNIHRTHMTVIGTGYGFSSKPDPGSWEERNNIYCFETWSQQVQSSVLRVAVVIISFSMLLSRSLDREEV